MVKLKSVNLLISTFYNIQYTIYPTDLNFRGRATHFLLKYIGKLFYYVPIIQTLLYSHVEKDMTVYIVQELRGRNFADATSFGDCEILLPADLQTSYSTLPTIRKLTQKLAGFCDDDYLLLIGDPAAIGIACSIASDVNRGRYKCLKWDKIEATYYPIEIDLYNKGEI